VERLHALRRIRRNYGPALGRGVLRITMLREQGHTLTGSKVGNLILLSAFSARESTSASLRASEIDHGDLVKRMADQPI